MQQLIEQLAQQANLPLAAGLAQKLSCHWQLLAEANSHFNITAITDPAAAAEKHYLDCLLAGAAAAAYLPATGAVADIGSGGGFPGLVLAAASPQLDFTLIESSQKKTAFLLESAAQMGLDNLRAVPLRAEEAGRNPSLRAAFDVVTARAVAELNVLAEYSLPLLREGGFFLALKGPEPQEELAGAAHALKLLGGTVAQVLTYSLPCSQEGRSVVVLRKSAPTPEKYPRRPGMPNKRPL